MVSYSYGLNIACKLSLTEAQISSCMKGWRWRLVILVWPQWRRGGAALIEWSSRPDPFCGWCVRERVNISALILTAPIHCRASIAETHDLRWPNSELESCVILADADLLSVGSWGHPDAGQQSVQFPVGCVLVRYRPVWADDGRTALLYDRKQRSGAKTLSVLTLTLSPPVVSSQTSCNASK